MDKQKAIFNKVTSILMNRNYYVPRSYLTVGGIWTVDTYSKGDVTVQVMDEGWTIRLITSNVVATESGNTFRIDKGSLEDFQEVLELVS
jgi:hypothetical protein